MGEQYVIGIDFGSDSVRAILVDTRSAQTLQTAVAEYPRWKEKKYCDDKISQYRQHPMDYLECMEFVLKKLLKEEPNKARNVAGIAVDTTGSTVCPVNEAGIPLSLLKEFSEDPDAMFHLWKDHTAVQEASEINRVLSNAKVDYTKYQGEYSAEWFWAKILHTTRKNKAVKEAAYTWVEHVDWITGILTGNIKPETIAHCSCAAGHKALWNSEFGGLPDKETLEALDPYLGKIHDRYLQKPNYGGEKVGTLCTEWASKLGLSENIAIGMGSFDAHAGAVGVGIREKTMVKVVGTSTVDMIITKKENVLGKDSKAFCGLAEDSIIPGFLGAEAGQSAFGDTYAWLKKVLMWPLHEMEIPEQILSQKQKNELCEFISENLLKKMEHEIQNMEDDTLIALDWFNGRRYLHLNEKIKSSITGLTLGTTAPEIYRALVQATVFGSRRIYDSLKELGMEIEKVICVGGIAQKSGYIMQMMADVLNVPIMVSEENQSCARGAAVYAAVAAGIFDNILDAQSRLCEEYKPNYYPNKDTHLSLEVKYRMYCCLGEKTEQGF